MTDSSDPAENDIERAAELIEKEMDRVARWKAVHEAGHSVVALSLDWEVDHISIEQTQELDAHASLKAREPNDTPLDYVRVGLAGALAVHIENRLRPMKPGQDGGVADEKRIEMMLHASGYAESAHPEIRERVRQETLLVLEARWAQVEALASAIEMEGTIDRRRISEILAGLDS